jgi:hypothetical protein
MDNKNDATGYHEFWRDEEKNKKVTEANIRDLARPFSIYSDNTENTPPDLPQSFVRLMEYKVYYSEQFSDILRKLTGTNRIHIAIKNTAGLDLVLSDNKNVYISGNTSNVTKLQVVASDFRVTGMDSLTIVICTKVPKPQDNDRNYSTKSREWKKYTGAVISLIGKTDGARLTRYVQNTEEYLEMDWSDKRDKPITLMRS